METLQITEKDAKEQFFLFLTHLKTSGKLGMLQDLSRSMMDYINSEDAENELRAELSKQPHLSLSRSGIHINGTADTIRDAVGEVIASLDKDQALQLTSDLGNILLDIFHRVVYEQFAAASPSREHFSSIINQAMADNDESHTILNTLIAIKGYCVALSNVVDLDGYHVVPTLDFFSRMNDTDHEICDLTRLDKILGEARRNEERGN